MNPWHHVDVQKQTLSCSATSDVYVRLDGSPDLSCLWLVQHRHISWNIPKVCSDTNSMSPKNIWGQALQMTSASLFRSQTYHHPSSCMINAITLTWYHVYGSWIRCMVYAWDRIQQSYGWVRMYSQLVCTVYSGGAERCGAGWGCDEGGSVRICLLIAGKWAAFYWTSGIPLHRVISG